MSEINNSDRDAQSGRFLSGCKPGPGRAQGSRNRLAENFLAAFADDFEKHGAAVIARVRSEAPTAYLRAAVDLLPREATLDIDVNVLHDVRSALEAYRTLSAVVGADPAQGLRRLKRLAPDIIDVEPS